MINTDSKGQTIDNLSELSRDYQPSIPKLFPKDKIPQEKCQEVLAQMLLCTMNSSPNLCGVETKNYFMCRRERDAQLFGAIKQWELDHVKQIKNRSQYLNQLVTEKKTIEEELEKIPKTIANKHKRWRAESDIAQLGVRIDYLS